MKFTEIKKFTGLNTYSIHVSWNRIIDHLGEWGSRYESTAKLDLNPDFQRGHVWTEQQQISYIEYKLANGPGADVIYFNCVGWMNSFEGPFVCVDGLQRLTAVRVFLENKIKAYGFYCSEFEDQHQLSSINFVLKVNNLKTRDEVLKWYLEMNIQGTPHTKEELNKVKELLEKEK